MNEPAFGRAASLSQRENSPAERPLPPAADLRPSFGNAYAFGKVRHKQAGVEFIDENGGGPGVRLRRRQQKKG